VCCWGAEITRVTEKEMKLGGAVLTLLSQDCGNHEVCCKLVNVKIELDYMRSTFLCNHDICNCPIKIRRFKKYRLCFYFLFFFI
jgi:hypothetical protein